MGILYIVATPIGNREDITVRAIKTLASVDVVLCEDTRKTGLLLKYYRETEPYRTLIGSIDPVETPRRDVSTRSLSYYEENEEMRIPEIVRLLLNGSSIALVSDAGTPLISDPGFKLVRECYRRNIRVVPIPGPSSVIAALSASGLPSDSFAFLGYMPKKSGKREQFIHRIQTFLLGRDGACLPAGSAGPVSTVILFETPHRIRETLNAIQTVAPELTVTIAHELTKIHETFIQRATVDGLPESTKGEYVLMINSRTQIQ